MRLEGCRDALAVGHCMVIGGWAVQGYSAFGDGGEAVREILRWRTPVTLGGWIFLGRALHGRLGENTSM